MPELVKIPLSSAEYLVRFDRPYVGLISTERPRAFEAVVAALLPFNFRLANTEIVTTGTLADHKVIFKIPERGISFQFGAEEYRFGKEGSLWSIAEQDAEVLLAAERALLEASGAHYQSCQATIAMHLQPLAKARAVILEPFVPDPFKPLLITRHALTFGNHLKWTDGEVLLDFSLALANGIFLRLISKFDGHPPLNEVLKKVRDDEETLFGILGIEEEVASA
jgi:hypothetical protein